MRLLYDTAASPFLQASRWFTVPWSGWNETDLSLSSFIGGVVWEDRDRDGIREASEPRLGGITVDLLDDSSTLVDRIFTDSAGEFELFPIGSEECQLSQAVDLGNGNCSVEDSGSRGVRYNWSENRDLFSGQQGMEIFRGAANPVRHHH